MGTDQGTWGTEVPSGVQGTEYGNQWDRDKNFHTVMRGTYTHVPLWLRPFFRILGHCEIMHFQNLLIFGKKISEIFMYLFGQEVPIKFWK